MLIIRNSVLPFGKDYGAINLFGILFIKNGMNLTPQVINHEKIHTAQMRELLYIPFYILYVLEWIFRLFQFRGNTFTAYKNITFEREAYAHGKNLKYLSGRKSFSQWRR